LITDPDPTPASFFELPDLDAPETDEDEDEEDDEEEEDEDEGRVTKADEIEVPL